MSRLFRPPDVKITETDSYFKWCLRHEQISAGDPTEAGPVPREFWRLFHPQKQRRGCGEGDQETLKDGAVTHTEPRTPAPGARRTERWCG